MWSWLKKASSLEFSSRDARFRIQVPSRVVARLLRLCWCSGHVETGGILAGTYSAALDCACVSRISGAPRDSSSGPTWFERGTSGLQAWLDHHWASRRERYLGEWHFHPGAAPVPSPTDRHQLHTIARTPSYACPEPVLLILGGDPAGRWEVSAHVFPRGREAVALHRV